MSDQPQSSDVPPWKFWVAVMVMLVAVTLGTLFWMWRDSKPRRRPALLGTPDPVRVETNASPNR